MSRFSPLEWPVFRQFRTADSTGRSSAVVSQRTRDITSRTETADRVVQSICPYCAVGCGQKVYVKDDKVIQIEGDPDSPISVVVCAPRGLRANSSSTLLVDRPACCTAHPAPPIGKSWTSIPRRT